MKYLKLKIEQAKVMTEKPTSCRIGVNRFYHPMTQLHVYNSVCVLLDRTPKPQFRKTDDKYMPLYTDVLDAVSNGYININIIAEDEAITTMKCASDSNDDRSFIYTWKDCKYLTGTLMPIFIYKVSEILNKKVEEIEKEPFTNIVTNIQQLGIQNSKGSFEYSDENILDLFKWCQENNIKPLVNFIANDNKAMPYMSRYFGRRVYRGCGTKDKYDGVMYIPLTDNLFDELIQHTKGFSSILDGGLVTILDYDFLKEDDIVDFIKISDLNSIRKFNELTHGVKWNNTIFKNITVNNYKLEMINIIKQAGISIEKNQKEFDELMKKLSTLNKTYDNVLEKYNNSEVKIEKLQEADKKFNKDICYKLNYFIQKSVKKLYN